ncbi:hypothetical protein TRICHSKD4_2955 [Roseibium sp. TrichSKD4]|uniref:HlyD family secretion protein n=1 Tax=Roseibium sp. TrichSKD4 TaxID=744980 RepID=UPI0001E569EA|nr:hypothetical protein [Roseibium sp. TrichSKD4]EFO31864.1 hypothetical protein TRICHSKD4_2955 [Roseibium sp. TrichSKD4]
MPSSGQLRHAKTNNVAAWVIRGLPSTHFSTKIIVFVLSTTFLSAISLAISVKLPEIRKVKGQVRAQGLIANIAAPRAGRILEVMVSRDESVKKNQPLIAIGTDLVREEKGDANEIERERIKKRILQLENQKTNFEDKLLLEQETHAVTTRQLANEESTHKHLLRTISGEEKLLKQKCDRLQTLHDRGVVSEDQRETCLLKINDTEQRHIREKLGLLHLQRNTEEQKKRNQETTSALQNDITKVMAEIDLLSLELLDLENRDSITLLAPFNGFVTHIRTQKGSSVFSNGAPLIQISQDHREQGGFFTEFVVQSRNLRDVAVGHAVRIELVTFDVSEWGTFPAVITNISETGLPNLNLPSQSAEDKPSFLIEAAFNRDATFDREILPKLRDGLEVTGFISIDQRPLISWIIEPIERVYEILSWTPEKT